MTNGQKVAVTALNLVAQGIREVPYASNSGRGFIDDCQHYFHMGAGTGVGPVAWCGCGEKRIYVLAGVDDGGLISPSTALMCQFGESHGMKWNWRARRIPPGASLVHCGVHTDTIVNHRWPTTIIDGVGCNVNNGVRKTVRNLSDGFWEVFVPPALLEGEPEPITMYGLDDITLRPETLGPWAKRDWREDVIKERYSQLDAQHQIRRIKVPGKNPFAFEIIRSGRPEWKLGPWMDLDVRERVSKERVKQGHRVREWSIKVDHLAGTGGVTHGDSQT
jgi:hypothetical protein